MDKVILDHIVELGFDAGLNGIKQNIDKQKLRSALYEYIAAQAKINEEISSEEEIDFQGLIDYIHANFLDEVSRRIYNIKPKERAKARSEIVKAAIVYSHANSDESKRRVNRFINDCLDIYHEFFKKRIPKEWYILAADVVDGINKHIDEKDKEIMDKVNELDAHIQNASLYSVENTCDDVMAGRYQRIAKKITDHLEFASQKHPLRPYYKYDYKDGELVSKPAFPEAEKLYPEKFEFTGVAHVGNRTFTNPDEMQNYAYRHQLAMVMDVTNVKKYLGDIEDPIQPAIKGGKLYVYPKKFPPAFPCSIKVNDVTYFEYILLRTREVLDDGTYIIDNSEQDKTPYLIEVRIHNISLAGASGTTNFKIGIKNASHKQHLTYSKFMKAVSEAGTVSVHILNADTDLLRGKIGDVSYNNGFRNVNEEVDFLERVCDVDKYIGKELAIPERISVSELKPLELISDLLRGKVIRRKWKKITLDGVMDQHFKKVLMHIEKGPSRLSVVGSGSVKLFGDEIHFKYMMELEEAYIDNLDKLRKLSNILDDGDPMKIELRAGKNDTFIETMNLPENIKEREA